MNEPSSQKPPSIKETVLTRIKTEQLVPQPRWRFVCLECVVWTVWSLSVVLGAISLSVMAAVWMLRRNDIYEATHDSWWYFVLTVLPYIWCVVFVATGVAAYYYLRRTKRGYKYSVWYVLLTSLGASMFLGVLLYHTGMGMWLDKKLGAVMPMYSSQEKLDLKLWQAPHDGRLVGVLLRTDEPVFLRDIEGQDWRIITQELPPDDMEALMQGKQVRLLGMAAASSSQEFYACGVFPWIFDPDMPPDWMGDMRREFLTRMYEHETKYERLRELQAEIAATHTMGRCSELPMIGRLKRSMEN